MDQHDQEITDKEALARSVQGGTRLASYLTTGGSRASTAQGATERPPYLI